MISQQQLPLKNIREPQDGAAGDSPVWGNAPLGKEFQRELLTSQVSSCPYAPMASADTLQQAEKWVCTSYNAHETLDLGRRMGECLSCGGVVAFRGDLGAGKTLLIKGIAQGAAGIDPDQIQSPTFVHLNVHEGTQRVFHFDLYRLRDADAFLGMGFDDYLFTEGLCCIEWSERIESIIPDFALRIELFHLGGDLRRIEMPMVQAAALWSGHSSLFRQP